MIALAVYLLCMLTSAFCAALLLREYRRTSARLLLWSSLAFFGWALNNLLVFTDFILIPSVDLALMRTTVALCSVGLLLYGLIWDVG